MGYPCLVPLLTAQVLALAWKKKISSPEGKPKQWEVGGQKRRPDRSLQIILGLVELDNTVGNSLLGT